MQSHTPLQRTEQAQQWLGQFAMGDRALAEQLLGSLVLVSRDDFVDHLRELIIEQAARIHGVVALYAERELRHRAKVPHRLFQEPRRKPQRAEGATGPPPVKATKAYDPSVGSEGLVAHLITELAKEFPKKFLNHPGPDRIRDNQVRAFWVVTDIVGSGDRVRRYLEAAWLVRSVRSWWSGKFMTFAVVAYASTEDGEKVVRGHPCKPELLHVMPAPTIRTAFSKDKAAQMTRLCETYDPSVAPTKRGLWGHWGAALGYGGLGVLMVFAHSTPNNIPLIFHKGSLRKRQPWVPLFPSRVSAGIDRAAYGVALTQEKIQQKLADLGEKRLSKSRVVNADLPTWEVFALLTALARKPRHRDSVLSRRSGLETFKVRQLCRLMTECGWLDSQRRLTDAGLGQLRHARKQVDRSRQDLELPAVHVRLMPYYPKSLRPPV